jgi:hypothetical protein
MNRPRLDGSSQKKYLFISLIEFEVQMVLLGGVENSRQFFQKMIFLPGFSF